MRRLLASTLVLCAASASCATWSYEEFDRLSRTSRARTVVHEPGFSLYSPYDARTTHEWVVRVTDIDARLSAFLGPHARPWVIVLVPHQELAPDVKVTGGSLTFPTLAKRTACGIGGFAFDRTAQIYVAPPVLVKLEGREPLTLLVTSESADPTLSHELSHLYLNESGIDAPWWLSEGFAHLAEDAAVRDGGVVIEGAGVVAAELATLSEADLDLARTLRFEEDVAAISLGAPHPHPHGRPVARAFVQYLLARSDVGVLETLRRLAKADASELLAEEERWREWLELQRKAGIEPPEH